MYLTIILLLIILLVYYKANPLSNNKFKHIYEIGHGGHFSAITTQNILLYPKYLLTHPTKYILNEGDGLYIPRNWWHWVFSEPNTFAVNYWSTGNYMKDLQVDQQVDQPQLKQNIIKPFDLKQNIKLIKNMELDVVDGGKEQNINLDLNTLIRTNNNDMLLTTAIVYANNEKFKHELDLLIEKPSLIMNNQTNGSNFWYSSGKTDTGLHYDEHNGLLCVLSGTKTIYIYPPSDASYLYPYDINHHRNMMDQFRIKNQ